MKRIKAGVIVVVALFIAASVSAGVKDGQCPEGSNPTDKNASRFTNSIGMEFVKIPSGKGRLSKDKWDVFERYREVNFPQGFYMQATEVTQRQYKKVMGNDPSLFKFRRDDFPVEQVSKDDALAFIQRLNEMEDTTEYRLPTSDEWEYGCRAGTTSQYYTGDCIMAEQANIDLSQGKAQVCSNSKEIRLGRPQPVKSYPANSYGLFDMHGNVSEWVVDPCDKPIGACGGVTMGGSYFNWVGLCRSSNRDDQIVLKNRTIGFRVVAGHGVKPKPYHGKPERYVDPLPDLMWGRKKMLVLRRFFSVADFSEPKVDLTNRGKKKRELIQRLAEDFEDQVNLTHLEPLFIVDRIDDSKFAPYVAINPAVHLNEFDYGGPHVATRDLALFEVEVDGNIENGKEIVVFGDDFNSYTGTYHSDGAWYQVFHRENLKYIGKYRPSHDSIYSPPWPRSNVLHGLLKYQGNIFFWWAWWFENEKRFYLKLEIDQYEKEKKKVETLGNVKWDK